MQKPLYQKIDLVYIELQLVATIFIKDPVLVLKRQILMVFVLVLVILSATILLFVQTKVVR